MALLETLTDQFNEAIDTAKWNSFTTGTATIDQSGGVVTATPPSSTAGSNYAGYTSDNTYDLTASYGFIQIAQAVNSAVGAQQYFKLVKDGSNDLQWLLENGSLQASKNVAASRTNVGSAITFNSSTHRWWRIREASGTIYFDYASDGLSWSNHTSTANPFAVTAMSVEFAAGTYQSVASPGAGKFDDFNTGTSSPSASVSPSASRSPSPSVSPSASSSPSASLSPSASASLSASPSASLSPSASESPSASSSPSVSPSSSPSPSPPPEERPVRFIDQSVLVSWKRETSGLNLMGSPDNYLYTAEDPYVMGLAWESGLAQPVGGINKALAEVGLDNTSERFLPQFLGGMGELYTSVFEPRKPIKIYADTDTIPQLQFSGITNKATQIDMRAKQVRLQAADYIEFFQNKYLDTTTLYTGVTTDFILDKLLLAAGLTTAQYQLETGQSTIGFAMLESGARFSDVINQLVQAENGQFYVDENGVYHFENRLHYSTSPYNAVNYTAEDNLVINAQAPSADHLVNVVEFNYNPRKKTSSTNIFTLSGTIAVPSGESEVFIDFDNPVLSASAPSYTVNSQEDGSGSNLTANVTIKNTALFAQAVKYTFINSGAAGFFTSMTIQGRWAILRYSTPQYYRMKDDSSVTAYQEQVLSINNDYIQDKTWANSFGQLILSDFSEPEKILTITIRAIPGLRRGHLVVYNEYAWRIYHIRSTLDPTYGYIQELTMMQRGPASGSGVVYFQVDVTALDDVAVIAP